MEDEIDLKQLEEAEAQLAEQLRQARQAEKDVPSCPACRTRQMVREKRIPNWVWACYILFVVTIGICLSGRHPARAAMLVLVYVLLAVIQLCFGIGWPDYFCDKCGLQFKRPLDPGFGRGEEDSSPSTERPPASRPEA